MRIISHCMVVDKHRLIAKIEDRTRRTVPQGKQKIYSRKKLDMF